MNNKIFENLINMAECLNNNYDPFKFEWPLKNTQKFLDDTKFIRELYEIREFCDLGPEIKLLLILTIGKHL